MPSTAEVQDEDDASSAECEVPGYRNYLIFADESGTDGQPFYGFGTLWIPSPRRGDLADAVRALKLSHGKDATHEMKWHKTGRTTLALYKDALDYFFETRGLFFHCLVVRRGLVNLALHGTWEIAYRKHFGMLLRNKIGRAFSRPDDNRMFHVRVDKLHTNYEKAAEASHKILRAGLAADLKKEAPQVESFLERDSAKSAGIQLCDLLLGTVMAAHQDVVEGTEKIALMRHLAKHLQWADLKADTLPTTIKFNIWYFWPGPASARELPCREVNFLLPQSVYAGKG